MTHPAMILGEVASSGVARGPAFVCAFVEQTTVPRRVINETEIQKEMEKLDTAISEAAKELLDLKEIVQQKAGKQEAKIFETQILLLHDLSLREEISNRCLAERINVEAALDEAIEKLTSLFLRLEDPYFRERAADLRDVGKRLLDILTKSQRLGIANIPDGSVIVTGELFPSATGQLDGQTTRGIIVEKGGQTTHATILARALGIPLLIRVSDATTRIRTGDQLIVDGLAGRVFINPTEAIRREYDRLEADLQAHRTALKGLIELPAMTLDGVRIKLCANIGKSADAVAAATLNVDGVGLYRTEFVFLVQDHFPSEEEQYQMYRTTAEHLKQREVVIRVLDIGSDKLLPYFPLPLEANLALGCRGIRLLLAHPEILRVSIARNPSRQRDPPRFHSFSHGRWRRRPIGGQTGYRKRESKSGCRTPTVQSSRSGRSNDRNPVGRHYDRTLGPRSRFLQSRHKRSGPVRFDY